MSKTYYEMLGRAVWKGGVWYLKHRYMPARRGGRARVLAKRLAAGAAVAALIAAALAAVQRHGDAG